MFEIMYELYKKNMSEEEALRKKKRNIVKNMEISQ